MILHITSRSQWQQSQQDGEYRAPSLDSEGFIHCSRPEQILRVANRFYAGQRDLLLLSIDPNLLTAELRYDEIETGEHFPHLYGPLNLDAVVQALSFEPNEQGQFEGCHFGF
jgi:uncharacterized protein (DUF952 family)